MVTAFASILDVQPSFELAVLFITWVAIVFLGLIAVSLHIRLQRLEHADLGRKQAVPFSHLLSRTVAEVLNGVVPHPPPRLILFLSPSCPACEQLLAELRAPSWKTPVAVVWTVSALDQLPDLPPQATFVPDGPGISAALGIRVTPFALVAGERGEIVGASPVNRLESLRDALEDGRGASLFSVSR